MKYNDTGRAIIDAARKLFGEKGYKGVTTREIARIAGINEVTLFRHFGTKENLFDAVLDEVICPPDLEKLAEQHNPVIDELLRSAGTVIHDFFTENMDIMRIVLMEPGLADRSLIIRQFPGRIRTILREQLVQLHGLDTDEADVRAVTFISAVHGLCMGIYFFKSFDAPVDFTASLDCLIRLYR